jgi:ent-kaurene synthase
MMTEAEWGRVQYVPTIDEYMTNAKLSYALGPIVLPSLYFLGQELSVCVVEDQEYDELFSLMSTCCRLLNDIQGFEVCGPVCAQFLCLADPIPIHVSRFRIAA